MKKVYLPGREELVQVRKYPHAPKQLQSGRHVGSSVVLETGLEGGKMRCGTKKTVRNSRPARCAKPTAHYCIDGCAKFQKIFICVFLYAVTKWFFSMKALNYINKVKKY